MATDCLRHQPRLLSPSLQYRARFLQTIFSPRRKEEVSRSPKGLLRRPRVPSLCLQLECGLAQYAQDTSASSDLSSIRFPASRSSSPASSLLSSLSVSLSNIKRAIEWDGRDGMGLSGRANEAAPIKLRKRVDLSPIELEILKVASHAAATAFHGNDAPSHLSSYRRPCRLIKTFREMGGCCTWRARAWR